MDCADQLQKFPINVEGTYFTLESCIGCASCVVAAPKNFKMHDDGYAYVFKQPENPAEQGQCDEAIRSMPRDLLCIGKSR